MSNEWKMARTENGTVGIFNTWNFSAQYDMTGDLVPEFAENLHRLFTLLEAQRLAVRKWKVIVDARQAEDQQILYHETIQELAKEHALPELASYLEENSLELYINVKHPVVRHEMLVHGATIADAYDNTRKLLQALDIDIISINPAE